MAVIDRAFSAVPFFGMESHQTSHPFLQRTNAPGILNASVSELSQMNSPPMGIGLNGDGSYYMHSQVYANSNHAGENGSLFLGHAAQSQSPAGIPVLSQITCTGLSGRSRKHRLQEEDNDGPSKKRRISASPIPPVFQESQTPGIFAGASGQPFWASSHSLGKEGAIIPTVANHSSAMMHPILTEDMEEVAVESQSDAALRRIRDIESRLVVEDDEEEEENNSKDGHLPTLVLSDILVEGFKKGLDESLTKKIVDSINRPSMELVLWKPQPEFLVNKLQSVAINYEDDKEVTEEIQSTSATHLLQEVNPSSADKPCSSNLDCDIETLWNREEEEMEL
ncbi:coiled-coil domain-containing protein 117 [Leptodactylus fuscus]|uniref:coiled-coil domain-containing protein 117 n=1 Tax=Leptodactylus fuscus TaxID=238119 RepID=UPI003F4EBB7E